MLCVLLQVSLFAVMTFCVGCKGQNNKKKIFSFFLQHRRQHSLIQLDKVFLQRLHSVYF
jgi:hypothetical protein